MGFFVRIRIVKKPLIIILLVLLADQILKFWIKTHMYLGESIRVAGDWFYITFVENYGMAFGMEFGGEYGKLFLSLFRIVVVGTMLYYLFKAAKNNSLHQGLVVSFSLIVAGAIGNIIDSAVYGLLFSDSFGQVATFMPADGGYATFLHGRVVDMFYFPIIESQFPAWFPVWGGEEFTFFSPVFNLADMSISTGVGIFIIYQKHFFKEEKKVEISQEQPKQVE
jgi:signal peptidase II